MQCNLPKSFSFVNNFKKYDGNPILRPHGDIAADCIFNPGAVVHGDEITMLCRCINFSEPVSKDNWSVSTITYAHSSDGLNFKLDTKPFLCSDNDSMYKGGFEDPRLVWIEEEKLYVLTYTGVIYNKNTVGLLALSHDLKEWEFCGEVFQGRAIAITDRKINGKYWAYYGNTSIYMAYSEDLKNWELCERTAIDPRPGYFDSTLCEAVSAPVINDDGILLMYNGAASGKYRSDMGERVNGFRGNVEDDCYSIGWALFDRNEPTKLIARSEQPILEPEYAYELYGISEYTTFGNALINFNGRWYLYYGCSDTRIAVAISE